MPALMTFSATWRRTGWVCSASHTSPIPPSPTRWSRRSGPIVRGGAVRRGRGPRGVGVGGRGTVLRMGRHRAPPRASRADVADGLRIDGEVILLSMGVLKRRRGPGAPMPRAVGHGGARPAGSTASACPGRTATSASSRSVKDWPQDGATRSGSRRRTAGVRVDSDPTQPRGQRDIATPVCHGTLTRPRVLSPCLWA